MTGSAAGKAGHAGEKEKEKTGIRRALGRGLESLLPGPRVVAARAVVAPSGPQVGGQSDGDAGTRAGAPAPHSVRNDTVLSGAEVTTIQAVVEPDSAAAMAVQSPTFGESSGAIGAGAVEGSEWRTGVSAPHAPTGLENEPGAVAGAELRSARPDSFDSAQDRLRSGPTLPPPSLHAPTVHPATVHPSTLHPEEPLTLQASGEGRVPSNLVVHIPLDHIDKNPYQTRYLFDEEMLRELAASIQAQGVVQPVVVRPAEGGRYVLILGERRCRASKMAGKTSIPAIVRRVSEQQAAEMTIIENLQREDLNCMEQAEAFRVLSQEFKLTQQQIGERVGMSRESVSNYMRLLRLPETVMEYLATNKLTFSDAREIMMLDDPKLVAKAADIAVKKHLSIEKIEDLVMELQGLVNPPPGPNRHGPRWVDPNVKAAQSELERLLGVRVRIRDRRGRGKIVIEYATVDDYQRVLEALKRK